MGSPDVLDDIWKQGLGTLAPHPTYDVGARTRVEARVARNRRRRGAVQGVTVLVIVVAISFGVVAAVRGGGDDTGRPAGEPTTTLPAAAATRVEVTVEDGGISVLPQHVAPGPVDVLVVGPSGGGRAGLSVDVDGHTVVAAGATQGSFVATLDGRNSVVVRNGDRTLGSAVLTVVPRYEPLTAGPAQLVEFTAHPALTFTPHGVHLDPGLTEVVLVADGDGLHTLAIDGIPGFVLRVDTAGARAEGYVDLAPGEYSVYCTVPGHAEAGQTATLVVRAK